MTIKTNTSTTGRFAFEDCPGETLNMLDLKIDTENAFDLGSQSMACPSSSPSTSGSFSSTSSFYGPFTPSSRTSTPQQSINFGDSFENDSYMFDFTPPPSATSAYFPMDMRSTVAPNMLSHGLPSTPSRSNNLFDNSMALHGGIDFTPTQDLDASFGLPDGLPDGLSSSPLMIQTPPSQFGSNTSSFDLASMWGQTSEGSPIDFSSPAMSLTTPSAHLGSPYGNMSRRRVAMDGPQQTSAMLQQHLQTPTRTRASKPRSAQGKSGTHSQRAHRVTKNLDRIPPRKYKCDECKDKVYSRAEHLKRHKTELHSDNPTKWVCEFCVKPKVFGRSDNFRDHLRRHGEKNTGSRTKPQPGAAALLAKMESEMKTKKRRVIKAESPETPGSPDGMTMDFLSSPLMTSCKLE